MMHVRFNEAWHGKVHKQFYKLTAAQYATSCILLKTPHDLFSSLSFKYPTRLNVVSVARGEAGRNYLIYASLNEAGTTKQQVRKLLMCIFLVLVLFCPKHNFRVV